MCLYISIIEILYQNMTLHRSNISVRVFAGIIAIAAVLMILNSIIKEWDIEQDFGHGYFLTSEGDIFYRDSDQDYEFCMIPFGTYQYGFDEHWIIVETRTRSPYHLTPPGDTITGEASNYWIIDKSIQVDTDTPSTFDDIYYQGNAYSVIRKSLIGPLDSLSFEKEKQKRGIRVQFEKIKK